ncbi:AzlC family ABC transporter permease [Litoreibacter roseus]|uniref:Branched-chain amino acid transporter AzlC n=1 Tax=Litoreibacter roseus TaxID=2601869 RepID=A0A6N6JFA8_9RHOB|nr:AzlC family ABC transporter permease [Litoreibacter roseus]GFE65043.1 branched-chain amino acid transporter AzlC [Litoreibacter roseus]
MTAATSKSFFWQGCKAGVPFVLVVVPFAMLFGVAATEAGLPVSQTMGFTVVVIAGASQFAALQFMSENAPMFVVIASALAVNLRMAMYSAALTPHLGQEPLWKRALISYVLVDQTYALAFEKFERKHDLTLSQKTAYFLGAATPICPLWVLFTYLGALIGDGIPPEYGLDFALPIAFLAIVAPGLRTVAHIAAALVSIVLALALVSVPMNLGLLIAAIAAMMTGAEVERRMT